MRLRHHWTPSPEVRTGLKRLGTELVLPMVWDDQATRPENDPITTRFGLWCLDPATGGERTISAPFVIKASWLDAGDCRWRLPASEDGAVVLTLRLKGSYDLNYHLFTFDGVTWRQVVRTGSGQQLVLGEQTFKTWEAPGELAREDYPLSGGGLAAAGSPLVFAADFTHAFSYDSGPMTPVAAEYTATLARAETSPPPGLRGEMVDLREHPELRAILPPGHSTHGSDQTHFYVYEVEGGLVVLDADYRRQMHGVTYVDMP